MADRITPEQRSAIMSRIQSKDTRPKMAIRRALHAMGFRFRLHVRSLPGCPDIVLPKHSIAVQVTSPCHLSHRYALARPKLPADSCVFVAPVIVWLAGSQ